MWQHHHSHSQQPENSYVSSVLRLKALAAGSGQVNPHLLHEPYEPEIPIAHVQSSIQMQGNNQQAILHHLADPYYLTEAHKVCLLEKPPSSDNDLYRRHGAALEAILRDSVAGHGSEQNTSQWPIARGIASQPEKVARHYSLPRVAPYQSSQIHVIMSSYAVELSSHAKPTTEGLSRVYADPLQRLVLGSSSLVQANISVSSRYSFTEAAPTYC